ncbi:MAG: hypothetical protein K2N94_12100 [Lachnospiraceae bacterium]|nr:hypothetical protein [Lachnospiraceae bacterium]
MKKMWEALKNDKELQQFRQQWKEKFTEPFTPWNYDCFGGIDDYKQRIKDALDSGNPRKICDTCIKKKCKAWDAALMQRGGNRRDKEADKNPSI